jgi:hypothetical protein
MFFLGVRLGDDMYKNPPVVVASLLSSFTVKRLVYGVPLLLHE